VRATFITLIRSRIGEMKISGNSSQNKIFLMAIVAEMLAFNIESGLRLGISVEAFS
jgi:hypothetical protein